MKNTKRSLIFSGISLLLCCMLLLGTTFAWFTDSVTNIGNRIEAGELEIDLLMDKNGDGSYISIADGDGDIFSEAAGNGTLWEPGKTEIVYLGVQNKGSLALNYNIIINITDGNPGLVGSLEYAFLDGKKAADLTDVTNWTELKAIAGAVIGDIDVGETVAAPNGILDEIVHNNQQNETDYFALAVHMKEDAGSEYMNGSITIDVKVIAKQATAEMDGFNSDQYDANAAYMIDVSNENELIAAIQEGKNVRLTDSIELSQSVTFNKPAVVSLNGRTLTFTNSQNALLNVKDSLVVEGDGDINGGAIYVDTGAVLTINAGDDFQFVSSDNINGVITTAKNTTIEINGGTYTSTRNSCTRVINFLGTNLTIRNATVNANDNSGSMGVAISAPNAKRVILENIKVNAKSLTAVDLGDSAATIIGGSFTTNALDPLWDTPNPTIKYGGTLNISGATIDRAGIGILYYTIPYPNSVAGITQSNVTFVQVGNAASNYQDVDYIK